MTGEDSLFPNTRGADERFEFGIDLIVRGLETSQHQRSRSLHALPGCGASCGQLIPSLTEANPMRDSS